MESFLTLSEELHFGRTAERLRVSRAHVSQTVQKLERRIGAPLFERTSRRVALTPIGKRLRDDLAPLHASMREALERAVAAGRGIDGGLEIGFSGPWSGDFLMRTAQEFRTRHPGSEVGLCEVTPTDPFGSLRSGEYDLQLTEFPVEEADLVTGPVLISQQRMLVVPSNHTLARRDSVSLADLTRIPLLIPYGDIPDYWLDFHYPPRTPGGEPIARERAYTNWQEALALVAGGKGAVISAEQGARYLVRPGVTYLPLEDAPPLEYGLVWRRSGRTARVAVFEETAREQAGRG